MKIVVTGALGYIGSRLIHTLPVDFPELELVLVDHLEKERLSSLFGLPLANYRLEIADVLTAPLDRVFAGAAAVIHLAAATQAQSRARGLTRVAFAVEATGRVARACAAAGAPLLFPSTTSIYGSLAPLVDETCEELAPQSPYAEAKLASERLLATIARQEGLKYVVCRMGSVFGVSPGMRFRTAVNKFLWQACWGEPLTVWRTALHQRRPYLDIEDCVRSISFVVQRGRFDGAIFNLATASYEVAEILEVIRRHTPDMRVRLVDDQLMNQLSYAVSCQRVENLGFRFTGSLERAVSDTFRLLGNAGAASRRRHQGRGGHPLGDG